MCSAGVVGRQDDDDWRIVDVVSRKVATSLWDGQRKNRRNALTQCLSPSVKIKLPVAARSRSVTIHCLGDNSVWAAYLVEQMGTVLHFGRENAVALKQPQKCDENTTTVSVASVVNTDYRKTASQTHTLTAKRSRSVATPPTRVRTSF